MWALRGTRTWIGSWPAYRQLTGKDRLGLGAADQIGLPWHWGPNGYTTGDAANELAHLSLDPNVHIQEVKALACDIRPGRRPRRPALRALVREYQQRAGITDQTGTEM